MKKMGNPKIEFLKSKDGNEEIFVYGKDGERDFIVTYKLVKPYKQLKQYEGFKLLTLGGDHAISIVKSVDEALQVILDLFSHGNINLNQIKVYTSEWIGEQQ
jgi:hypothetical protein